jgi:phosphonate transport system substrate-binding protein
MGSHGSPRFWSRAVIILAVLLTVTPSVRDSDAARQELRIGLVPEMNIFEQVERFEPLAEHLSGRIGVPVRLTVLSRYGGIIDRISSKEVDGAFLGSFTAAEAITRLGMVPIARPVHADGTSTYQGYIIVRMDSGIENVHDMKGKSLALVDRATTAGYAYPLAYFRHHGVTDEQDHFGLIEFHGSHDQVIRAVLTGKADIGAAKSTVYDRLRRTDPQITGELRILAASRHVPSNGLLLSPNVERPLQKRIRTVLLSLERDPAGRPVLQKLGASGFVPTSENDYEPVTRISREAGLDLAAIGPVEE